MNAPKFVLVTISFVICLTIEAQLPGVRGINYKQLEGTHDIHLSPWGPYSKRYAGISHIPDLQSGLRFDVSVLPGYYRNKVMVPNVIFESGYYPWDISADMSKITYRYELEWKDKVYTDVTYSVIDSATVLVSMHCVNNTAIPQNLSLNLLAYLNYPDIYPSVQTLFPKGVTWVNALDYQSLKFVNPRPSDDLVYDGWMRAEVRHADFIEGRGIGKNFGADKGDEVSYTIDLLPSQQKGVVTIRYRMAEGDKGTFITKGMVNQKVNLIGTGKFELVRVPYQVAVSGKQTLSFVSEGGSAVEINGLWVGNEASSKEITLVPLEKGYSPEITTDKSQQNVLIKYKDVNAYYGLAWNFSPSMIRRVLSDELDYFFKRMVHEHVQTTLTGNKLGEFTNAYLRPVELAPMSHQTVYALVACGTKALVSQKLQKFNRSQQAFAQLEKAPDDYFQHILPEGEKYTFSQRMMRATLLSNIVYPIYTQGQYIRHFTPGKWWNSLYTWDSGFEALGLAEVDVNKAIQNLNAYTTPPGSQSAFIHHGSPVPVQMYAFYDLWNRTQSKEFLAHFYPRLKQYYEFMAGKSGSSTMASLNSKLLKTWDYFYNSGGWDDYPPQKAVHDQNLEGTVSPVITTAHCIRAAKILRKAAEVLNQKEDIRLYDQDIKVFSNALQTYSWDEQSGYFGYVVHDEQKNPKSFLRHSESGQNYNMGLDGAYPIFSGICTQKQQDTLLNKIFSDKHMWTPAGICVVDQAAAYYRIDGYWNGVVWMPHQWFMWKTMLDLGRTDFAFKIADKALQIWKQETDETYYTFEHFFAKTGRGAGWHQFSALSNPVLMWFSAYYKPGTVSTGFEVWIDSQSFNADYSNYEARLSFDRATLAHQRSMLVCMNPGFKYQVLINGKKADVVTRYNGLLEIPLPGSNESCTLHIKTL